MIKQIKRTRREIKCTKLLKPQSSQQVSDSYIVITKQGRTDRDANNVVSELVTTMHHIAIVVQI